MSDEKENSWRITGGQVLQVNGDFVETDLVLTDGVIAGVGDGIGGHKAEINAAGMLVLPGIVDLHGDAFERQIMPRPGVSFPLDLALNYTDRQMVASGITTAYHGVTYSWEPGLRSRDVVVGLMAAIEDGKGRFGCDTRFHFRFETYNLDAVDEVANWLETGRVDLLAFNNHMLSLQEKIRAGHSIAQNAERAGVKEAELMALVDSLISREADVPPVTERLAGIAREFDVSMASHEDRTAEIRRYYNTLGCSIAEFPLSIDAVQESGRLGNPVILGSPNIVRGGSHLGSLGINAAVAITQGQGYSRALCWTCVLPACADTTNLSILV